jgi:tripartite-type tricarboxylate transporter receptor subunit TctC
MHKLKLLALIAAFAASVVFSSAAPAQAWPTRPLRMIATLPPGGIADFTARIIGPKLADALGQPVIVENRVGAGGNIGTDFVAKSPPDGHALLVGIGGTAINVTLYKKLPFDTRRDLAPVALVGGAPLVLVVSAKTPVRSVKELVEYARSNPGRLNYASPATGTAVHLAGELMKYQGRFFAVHIPFRGAPAAMTALLAGDVDYMFDALLSSMMQVRAGRIRLLAVTTRERSPHFPDAPTMIESGFKDFEVSGWTGILTTGGTPQPVIDRLESELRRILAMPEVLAAFDKYGMNVHFAPAREFGAFIGTEIARWAVAVKYSGAQAD